MSAPFTVEAQVTQKLAKRMLISAAVSSGIAAFLSTGEFSLVMESLPQTLVTVGAPSAMGQLVVSAVDPNPGQTPADKLFKAAAGGAVAVSLMMLGGALPMIVDRETLSLVGTMAVGVYVGDMF